MSLKITFSKIKFEAFKRFFKTINFSTWASKSSCIRNKSYYYFLILKTENIIGLTNRTLIYVFIYFVKISSNFNNPFSEFTACFCLNCVQNFIYLFTDLLQIWVKHNPPFEYWKEQWQKGEISVNRTKENKENSE